MRLAAADAMWLSMRLQYDNKPLESMSAEEASTVAHMIVKAAAKADGEEVKQST